MENLNSNTEKPIYKKNWFIATSIIVGLFLGLIILGSILPKNEKQDIGKDEEREKDTTFEQKKTDYISELKKLLPDKIQDYQEVSDKKVWGSNSTNEIIQRIIDEQKEFLNYQSYFGKDEKLDSLLKIAENWFKKALENNFKDARIVYKNNLKEKLWENNVDIILSGDDYDKLIFVGGIFANNKNKKEFQATIEPIVKSLRFKFIEYKWYKYDTDGKIYELNTLKDNEISPN